MINPKKFISPEEPKKYFEAFSKIDLSSSWIYFSNVKVWESGMRYVISTPLPRIKRKPYKIIRLIRRIFEFLSGQEKRKRKEREDKYLKITERLRESISNIKYLSDSSLVEIDHNLAKRIGDVSSEILEKFKNRVNNPRHKKKMDAYDQGIKTIITKLTNKV